jgi:hypothetical protein
MLFVIEVESAGGGLGPCLVRHDFDGLPILTTRAPLVRFIFLCADTGEGVTVDVSGSGEDTHPRFQISGPDGSGDPSWPAEVTSNQMGLRVTPPDQTNVSVGAVLDFVE